MLDFAAFSQPPVSQTWDTWGRTVPVKESSFVLCLCTFQVYACAQQYIQVSGTFLKIKALKQTKEIHIWSRNRILCFTKSRWFQKKRNWGLLGESKDVDVNFKCVSPLFQKCKCHVINHGEFYNLFFSGFSCCLVCKGFVYAIIVIGSR